MTLQTLPGPDTTPKMKAPSIQSSFAWEPINLRVEFGDGYSERVADGPQEFRDTWTLSYRNLTQDEATILGRFIREHSSRKAFYWTPPWDAGTSDNPARDPLNPNRYKKKIWTFVPGSVQHDPQYGTGADAGAVESISLSGGTSLSGRVGITFQIVQEFDIVA